MEKSSVAPRGKEHHSSDGVFGDIAPVPSLVFVGKQKTATTSTSVSLPNYSVISPSITSL